MWKKRLEQAMSATDSEPGFQPPAQPASLMRLTRKLGVFVPSDLQALLMESDGVHSVFDMDGQKIEAGWLLWPVKSIGSESPGLAKKAKRATKGQLVFFAPGDDVMFAIDDAGAIFAWYELDGALRPVAKSLAEFVDGWCSGKLSV